MRVVVLGMGDLAEQPGGLNRYVAALSGALGVTPVTVSPRASLPVRLVRFARAVRAAGPADVADAHLALYALWPVVLGGLRRTPLVVHLHGPWADEDARAGAVARAVKRAVERVVYRRAARVVVLSRAVRDVAVERYGVDPARVVVLPPGVDTEIFTSEPRTGEGAREERMLLTVRRLVPRTGVDVLLAALPDVPGARLVVVGDGPERPRLEALAPPGRVAFTGRVDDAELAHWYRRAAVTVLPSVAHEGWGLVVDESLACGTPVVASRQGGLLDALPAECLVPPGDPAALAARLRAALDGSQPLPTRPVRGWEQVAARSREVLADVARPRVVVVGHSAQPSGEVLALTVLAPELSRHVELTVVLLEDGPVAHRLRAAGTAVDVLPLPAGLAGRGRAGLRPSDAAVAALYAVRLAALLRRRRASLVHAWTLEAGLVAVPAARLARVPTVRSARDRLAPHPASAPLVRLRTRGPRGPLAARASGVADRVDLLGHRDDVAGLLEVYREVLP